MDISKLRKAFSPFGQIERIESFFDQNYALLYYTTEKAADKAIQTLDGQPFENAPQISVYKPSLQDPAWRGEEDIDIQAEPITEKGRTFQLRPCLHSGLGGFSGSLFETIS